MHEPGGYQPDSISSMVTVRMEFLVGTITIYNIVDTGVKEIPPIVFLKARAKERMKMKNNKARDNAGDQETN